MDQARFRFHSRDNIADRFCPWGVAHLQNQMTKTDAVLWLTVGILVPFSHILFDQLLIKAS